jgi:hypothetical protein
MVVQWVVDRDPDVEEAVVRRPKVDVRRRWRLMDGI